MGGGSSSRFNCTLIKFTLGILCFNDVKQKKCYLLKYVLYSVLGLNDGSKTIKNIHLQRPTRVYRLKGLLGKATDNYFVTGKVMEKATFGHVNRSKLDRILAAMQAAHQRHMYQ